MAMHVRVDVPPVPAALEALADGVVQLNVVLMQAAIAHGFAFPDLYTSGVVYRREPPGREWWESALDVMQVGASGEGDCEDLANYLAAWLRVYCDDFAHTKVVRTERGSFHAIVEHADGTLEDPSLMLVLLERRRKMRRRKVRA